jgi:hypothetical protein
MKFINRDWKRTEHDDFLLNIQPQLANNKEAVPQYFESAVVGWIIQFKCE